MSARTATAAARPWGGQSRSTTLRRELCCRTISGFSTARTVPGGHRRRRCHPLRLARKTALAEEMACIEQGDHGLFPACDKTDSRTTPSSRYMTLVAGEPCAKILVAGSYSTRCVRTPVQSSTSVGVSVGARFDLAIAHSPSVARAPPTATGVRRRVTDSGSLGLTRTSCVRKSHSAQVVGYNPGPVLRQCFSRELRNYTIATAGTGSRGRSRVKTHPL